MSYFVPTRFVWRFGGRQVHLCGSFTRWVETVPMAPVDGNPSVFAVVVHLPPGYHQYKFIVDGKWRHDETAPFMPDPLGNVNNWLFVRRIEPAPSAGPFDQQPQQQQQPQQPHLIAQQQQQHQQQAAAAVQQHLLAQSQLHPAQHPALRTPTGPGGIGIAHPASTGAGTGSGGGGGGLGGAALSHPVLNHHHNSASQNGIAGVAHSASASNVAAPPPAPEVDMANAAEAVVAPIAIHNPKEPEYTRKKVSEFLRTHTAYELIPESGKVVMLDMDLPVRQAFHALHEQGIASAPLWDSEGCSIMGVISASDFINILKHLRNSVTASGNPMSEQEMDAHTIRGLREQMVAEGRDPKPLVYVRPDDHLAQVVRTLSSNKCSLAPILSIDPGGAQTPDVLHLATLSAVLACLMRHFRASLASLPLLAQPLASLPLGTWAPDASAAMQADMLPDSKDARRQWRRIMPLHTVTTSTPLTQALGLLLEAGVSALPVVDEQRCLVDVYARGDITALARGNAYNRLQWEDVTVGQALSLASTSMHGSGSGTWSGAQGAGSNPSLSTGVSAQHPAMGGLSAEFHAVQQRQRQAAQQQQQQQQLSGGGDSQHQHGAVYSGPGPGGRQTRVHACTKDDSLRTVVEKLAIPGVRRLVVVQPETRRVEGVISLSDVASYLFL